MDGGSITERQMPHLDWYTSQMNARGLISMNKKLSIVNRNQTFFVVIFF